MHCRALVTATLSTALAAAVATSPTLIDQARAAYPQTAPSAGQLCKTSDTGVVTTAANGGTVRCTADGSYHRWKAVSSPPTPSTSPSPSDAARARAAAAAAQARLARKLLINQRISQATILRANAIETKLDAGLEGADIRDGALAFTKFASSVTLVGAQGVVDPAPNPRRALDVPPLPAPSGNALTPSATQLRTNQRIAQAAVRRANALAVRVNGELTGGDLQLFALTPAKLAPGIQIVAFLDQPRPAPSRTIIAPASIGGGTVQLSDNQLRINQRISQAAIRRLNELRDQIETGLTGDAFADGTFTGSNLLR